MGTESSVQVFCPDYQRLLKESQIALTIWNNGRANIHNAGRRGRDVDNTLRTLQGNFARAWAALQRHDQVLRSLSTCFDHRGACVPWTKPPTDIRYLNA